MILVYIFSLFGFICFITYTIDFIKFRKQVKDMQKVKKFFKDNFNDDHNPWVILNKQKIGRISQSEAKNLKVNDFIELEEKVYKVKNLCINNLNKSVIMLDVEE